MSYAKTQRKNKRPGEYKAKVSRRNKQAQYWNEKLDKELAQAILRDK